MMEPQPLFLTAEEISTLTGRRLRRLQIEALRRMMIPFHVNAIGHPVVTRQAVTGAGHHLPAATKSWQPKAVERR
ncbi:DUF4224 domain-containing protein [Oryzomicrobium terrae]|uniref:DUF4224 domain-containing protein n=1 Tax=Oryzomicrobium terrae TaxID=1735038 RepID=UPI001CA81B9C